MSEKWAYEAEEYWLKLERLAETGRIELGENNGAFLLHLQKQNSPLVNCGNIWRSVRLAWKGSQQEVDLIAWWRGDRTGGWGRTERERGPEVSSGTMSKLPPTLTLGREEKYSG